MKLGAYTACDDVRSRKPWTCSSPTAWPRWRSTAAGSYLPHCHVDLLLSSQRARAEYLDVFASAGWN